MSKFRETFNQNCLRLRRSNNDKNNLGIMTIGEKINIQNNQPLEERFKLLIKNRIGNSYNNDEGNLINIYSSSILINKELLKKGIEYKDKNIDNLILEFDELILKGFLEQNRTIIVAELRVLKSYIMEVSFYINDYQYGKMTLAQKNNFKNLRGFSELLRENKFKTNL